VIYLYSDHLNTPRLAMDEQNAVVWRSQPLAEPFGMSPPEEDPLAVKAKPCGRCAALTE
jgi:hypothetical protein